MAATRLATLCQSPFANGLDGYYYAEQIRSLRLLGHLAIVDNSPVLYFMGALDFLVGDPVATTKLASALFAAWLCLAAAWTVRRFGGGEHRALLAALLAGASPTVAFMGVDYVKNCGALAVLVFAIGWFAAWLAPERPDWRRAPAALGLAGLCFASHRLGAALLGCFVLALAAQKGRRWRGGAAALGLGLALVALALSLAKGGFVWSDLDRLLPAFDPGGGGAWTAPAFWRGLPWPVVAELGLCALVPPALAGLLPRAAPAWRALWACAALLFLPVWDLSVLDLGFRLQSNGAVLAALLAAAAAPPPRRAWPWLLAAALAVLPCQRPLYRLETDPPFRLYQAATRDIELPADSLLICHPGLNNFYTYNHQLKDALAFLPEYPVPADRLWRLSHGVALAEFRAAVPEAVAAGLARREAGPYVLVREDAWRDFLARVDPGRRADLENWYNPHSLRPRFLLDKNR